MTLSKDEDFGEPQRSKAHTGGTQRATVAMLTKPLLAVAEEGQFANTLDMVDQATNTLDFESVMRCNLHAEVT